MKYLFIPLSLFLCLFMYSQDNFLIRYKSIKDNDLYMVGDDVLYFSPKKNFSVYYEGDNVFLDKRVSKDTVHIHSGNYYAYYFDNETLYFKSDFLNQTPKVKEKAPLFNWQLTTETKEKKGTLLYKATVSFRGRNYTAWYNPEIPIAIGPWKFHGLPGLIYEVYDDAILYKFSWYLYAIEKSEDITFKTTFTNYDMSLEKYVETLDDAYQNYKSTVDTRLPENFILTETKVIGLENYRQKKREIKYEWEK